VNEHRCIKLDVAVLGGGFAGVYCAKALSEALKRERDFKVGLISKENYMVFQPMLPEVASGSISPRHVVNPLRLLCRRACMYQGVVESVNWPERSLLLNAGPYSGNVQIEYNHLVLALGAMTDLRRVPGMPEHAFLMKNVGDAMYLRTTVIGRIEEANLETRREIRERLLTFVVVGGGYSGVETAGHLLDLFSMIHAYYPGIAQSDLKVWLIHGGDHLLPTLNRRLGDYSARKLRERGLKLILNQHVKSVTANRVYLKNGVEIEANTVISTVGNAPHPLVTSLCEANGLATMKGRILSTDTGQVKGQTHLWAVGDCAAFPDSDGVYSPGTAQFGMRQGILAGKNIARFTRGEPLRGFKFKGYGEMASIGHHVAVAEIFGVQFYGFLAWWMWRTIYLAKLPRVDRKVRVALDWTLDLFFPRDLNHLSPRHSNPVKDIYLEKGDILFEQGEPAFSFYIVKSGVVELCEDGETVRRIRSGGYFGERGLLGDGLWHYSARASEPANLVSISARIFHQLVSGIGSLGQFFQKSATKYQSREVAEAVGQKIPREVVSQPVARLMEQRLFTLKPEMTIKEALQVARNHPRSSYPVVDAEKHLLGTVTREDFYEFIKRRDTTPQTPIKEMMLAAVPTVSQETSVGEVMKCLLRNGSNKALVVDREEHLEGIVTVMDLVAAVADGDSEDRCG
jgi:NADH:ubiquinone reductase (H+-translocating)